MKLSVGIPDYDCDQIGIVGPEKAQGIHLLLAKNSRMDYDLILATH